MQETRAFAPLYIKSAPSPTGGTAQQGALALAVTVVAVITTNVNSAILPGTTSNNVCQFRVANKTAAWVHVSFGVFGNVPAATVNHPAVGPNSVEIFTVDPEVNGAAIFADIAPGTNTSVMFSRGGGI